MVRPVPMRDGVVARHFVQPAPAPGPARPGLSQR
jgi:hypothetical protein